MFGEKPLLERFEAARAQGSTMGFGADPPFPPSTPAPAPRSMVDQMIAVPRGPITLSDAIAAITSSLSAAVTPQDESAKELLLEWVAYGERLNTFFRGRAETRLDCLRSEDRRLTLAARELLGRIDESRRRQNGLMADWNNLEQTASVLRAELNGVLSANPGRLDDDDAYVLVEEVEAWRSRVAEAKAKVETQQRSMQPILNQIEQLDQQIAADAKKLEAIHHERLQVRDELAGFDVRGPLGTGLKGRPGHARLDT